MVYGRGLAWVVVGSAVGAPLAVGKNTHPPLLLLVWLHYKTSSSGCVSTAAALGLAWVVVGSAVGALLAVGKNTHPPLLLSVWLHYKTSSSGCVSTAAARFGTQLCLYSDDIAVHFQRHPTVKGALYGLRGSLAGPPGEHAARLRLHKL
jgi:hypothetical protein